MTDIIDNLLEAEATMRLAVYEFREAAQEIDRLKSWNHEARTQMAVDANKIAALEDEAERLRLRVENDAIRMAAASGEL